MEPSPSLSHRERDFLFQGEREFRPQREKDFHSTGRGISDP